MSRGVEIFGVQTRPCTVKKINDNTFSIILSQGLNRQIRKMCKKYKYIVTKLKRIRIVNLHLDDLEIGSWRHISQEELMELRNVVTVKEELI